MAELIIAIGLFLRDPVNYFGDLIAPLIASCIYKFRYANERDAFLASANLDQVFGSGPVLAKSWNFRAKFFERLCRFDRKISISPPPIILLPITLLPIVQPTKKPFLTPASTKEHAKPIQCQTSCYSGDQVHNQQADLPGECVNSTLLDQTGTASKPFLTPASPQIYADTIQRQTFCCSRDQVHNQQTDLPGEPVNLPLQNETDNASASFDIEAGSDIEARGVSSNETSFDADDEIGTSSPQTGNQNPPPDDDDDDDESNESPPNGVNITSANDDNKGKNELQFVFMVGGQIIATGIAAFALNNTSNMSSEAMVLRHILLGCMFVSLACLFYGLLLSVYKPHSLAALVVRVIGCTAMAFTLLIATGLNLPDKLMIGVTAVVCTLCLPAIILYAAKLRSAGS